MDERSKKLVENSGSRLVDDGWLWSDVDKEFGMGCSGLDVGTCAGGGMIFRDRKVIATVCEGGSIWNELLSDLLARPYSHV